MNPRGKVIVATSAVASGLGAAFWFIMDGATDGSSSHRADTLFNHSTVLGMDYTGKRSDVGPHRGASTYGPVLETNGQ